MKLEDCVRCPRLSGHAREVREAFPEYYAKPVGSWGDRRAQLLIVGLAPGLHGAYRTGKAFVGDASGTLLFEALANTGFATSSNASDARLINAKITNAVKCLPPKNAPLGSEVTQCRDWLEGELEAHAPKRLRNPRVILTLGGVAYQTVLRCLAPIERPKFEHGQAIEVRSKLMLVASFHPSRLNMNTGRINLGMLEDVLISAARYMEDGVIS